MAANAIRLRGRTVHFMTASVWAFVICSDIGCGSAPTTPSGVLPPERFPEGVIREAYRAADKHHQLISRLRCYCYCEPVGHTSLLDCFTDPNEHGAKCPICVAEALQASEMAESGVAEAEIISTIDATFAPPG